MAALVRDLLKPFSEPWKVDEQQGVGAAVEKPRIRRPQKLFAARSLSVVEARVRCRGGHGDSISISAADRADLKLDSKGPAAFEVLLTTGDVIDWSSYRKAREILVKYGVTLDASR